ncbi:MAG: DUF1800 family protein, partial [Angustibacter sp.]
MSLAANRRTIILAAALAQLSWAGSARAQPTAAYTVNSLPRLLARRVALGASAETSAEISAHGPAAWLAGQLNPASVPDAVFETYAARFTTRNLTISAVQRKLSKNSRLDDVLRTEVQYEHLARLLWSRRQLQAQLSDLWANHANIPVRFADGIAPSRAHYQAAIRRGSLGKFSDLLTTITRHPAMLTYLGNRWSTKRHPNENHGRELLE